MVNSINYSYLRNKKNTPIKNGRVLCNSIILKELVIECF